MLIILIIMFGKIRLNFENINYISYFYPENFKINDIALGLKSKGHELTILTGKPNYPKGRFYHRYSF